VQTAASGGSLIDRMLGAVQLKSETYEEVERDENATTQAMIVVVLAAIATGIGGLDQGVRGLVGGIVLGIVGWLVSSVVVYFVGTTILATPQTSATFGEVLRTLGFAYTPAILNVVGFIPVLGGIVALIAAILGLIAMIVAIRSAFEFTTGRAIGTAVIAFVIYVIAAAIIGAIFGLAIVATSPTT
jgi:hypothetical protein